ncbi:ribonuclease D, Exosome-associated factor Rrp6 [Artemisia annua]|uniref:Ribonuclease D, Exosome-associated factor Rrp6 n=1 Tax=Artemisia annua TaxID=35608 RepID=A0A2U1QDG4_ARTAN|nr:ribonuclease D, Exosome-associated factor Rrp6 [Artemisia annua]
MKKRLAQTSDIGELSDVLKNKHPLIDHHLGSITNIIQAAMQNANAFEEVAATLKREHLKMEQAARDASKMSEEALTSVGSSNVQQIKEPLNLIFSTFNQKTNVSSSFQNGIKISNEVSMEKQTGGGTSGYARDCKYGAWARKGALATGGRSQVFRLVQRHYRRRYHSLWYCSRSGFDRLLDLVDLDRDEVVESW